MIMEFAVIETGGKQYKIEPGKTLKIEKISGEHKEGESMSFDKVLLVSDGKEITVGTPYIKGAKIEAAFQEEGKNKKVTVVKFKPKSRYSKKKGHRQPYTKIAITTIKK